MHNCFLNYSFNNSIVSVAVIVLVGRDKHRIKGLLETSPTAWQLQHLYVLCASVFESISDCGWMGDCVFLRGWIRRLSDLICFLSLIRCWDSSCSVCRHHPHTQVWKWSVSVFLAMR
jgi:hypothetical protein